MFSNLFNSRKNREFQNEALPPNANFGFIGTDIHSHFIPGIDDGAKTMEDSLNLIRSMMDMGYTSIITTPHIMIDYYPNTSNNILAGLENVKSALKENNINIPIKAAAEYYIDESFVSLMETQPLLCIHGNEVLVEFSMIFEPPMLIEVLFKMITMGYRPIIAHPERYAFLFNKIERFYDFKDRGCLFQLNLLSLTGYYGQNVKKIAQLLIEKKLYNYLGTDMHHEKHAEAIKMMLESKEFYFTLFNYPFMNAQISF